MHSLNYGPMHAYGCTPVQFYKRYFKKVKQDGAHAIFVVPDWPHLKWHKKAMRFFCVTGCSRKEQNF